MNDYLKNSQEGCENTNDLSSPLEEPATHEAACEVRQTVQASEPSQEPASEAEEQETAPEQSVQSQEPESVADVSDSSQEPESSAEAPIRSVMQESAVEERNQEPVAPRQEPAASDIWNASPASSTYHSAGAGRKESPYADSPYLRYTSPTGGQTSGSIHPNVPPTASKPPKASKKEKKKGSSGGKVVAAALVFAVLGSTAGGLLGTHLTNNKWEKSSQQLQSQIDELEKKQSSVGYKAPSGSDGATVNSVSDGSLMTPSQVYEQNVHSVVSVVNTGVMSNGMIQQQFTGSGSGFILSEDGYILTNYHVVEGAQTLTVTTYDEVTRDATLVGFDAFNDVALLKIEANDLPAVVIGDSNALNVGDQVAAIGNPLGELASTQTVGYVSAKDRSVTTGGTTIHMIQTDAAINSGNSGGPLFNMYGQVVGITTAKYSGSSNSGASIEGIGFAIPINDVMTLVDDLMEYGYIANQAYLGVTVQEMDPQVAKAYSLPAGPRVETVTEGSCAQKAGMRPGDLIIALGDKKIASRSDLIYALRTFKAGDTTQITVFRSGQELTLDITLDEKPPQENPNIPSEQDKENMPKDGSYNDWYEYFFGKKNP